MNTSSLTGVVLAAAAVIWLAFFVPTWVKRDVSITATREATREIKNRVKAEFKVRTRSHSSLVLRSARLANVRRVLGFVTLLGVLVGALSLFDLGKLWAVGAGAIGVAVVSLIASRAAARAQAQTVVVARPVRPTNYADLYRAAVAYGEKTAPVAAPAAEGWVPRHMPAPLHAGHIGTLEQPVLAEVRPLVQPEIEIAVSGTDLDEILRRRRAI